MDTLVNVTRISQIIYFENSSDFEEWLRNNSRYRPFALCIVKVNDSQSTLYYGSRQLKDTVITDSYPDSPEYPINKIYLHFILRDTGEYFVDKIYYKFKDSKGNVRLPSLETKYINNFENSVLTFFDGSSAHLCSLTNGTISQKVINTLRSQVDVQAEEAPELFWEVYNS